MFDPHDTHLPAEPAEGKPRLGRPATGKALSRAEIQRRYRERQLCKSKDHSVEIAALMAEIDQLKIALGKEVIARRKSERLLREHLSNTTG